MKFAKTGNAIPCFQPYGGAAAHPPSDQVKRKSGRSDGPVGHGAVSSGRNEDDA